MEKQLNNLEIKDIETLKNRVRNYITKMYSLEVSDLKISDAPNKDGLFEVSYTGDIKSRRNLESLTDGTFRWNTVNGSFDCTESKLLTLEGAPQMVTGDFDCSYSHELQSLLGGPQKVGGDYKCRCCHKLTDLIGAPEVVSGKFTCFNCMELKSLEGISINPMPTSIDCSHCYRLQSLGPIETRMLSKVNTTYCDDLNLSRK